MHVLEGLVNAADNLAKAFELDRSAKKGFERGWLEARPDCVQLSLA